MIHAYAIEPALAATWGSVSAFEFRSLCTSFGLGTPRILLELPKFTRWRSKVLKVAQSQGMSDMESQRLTALLEILGEHRCKRPDTHYDGNRAWLENAEAEYERRAFGAILARTNPRGQQAVIVGSSLGAGADARWDRPTAATPERTPEAVAGAVRAMLENCREALFIDPHFGPENTRHRQMMAALLSALVGEHARMPERLELHCMDKSERAFFEEHAREMASDLPAGLDVCIHRWRERDGGEWFHNRYILTNIGGVIIGGGLDKGKSGQSDDLNLMSREQYEKRWRQFGDRDRAPFDAEATPVLIRGEKRSRAQIKPRSR